jgi:hypothetical protein
MRSGAAEVPKTTRSALPAAAQAPPDRLLLKDYRPRSIYNVPKTDVKKAKYPILDAHCHHFPQPGHIIEMVKMMDAVGVEKTVIFTGTSSAEQFKAIRQMYSRYPGRFDLWCSFDLTRNDQSGFEPNAVKALEECHRAGALGVGEVTDKGSGFGGATAILGSGGRVLGRATGESNVMGPHPDDPDLDPLWDMCAQLGMPVNIHVSGPIWAYQPMDNTNDGLMNGYVWRIEVKPPILGHDQLITALERLLRRHPKTTFVACHLANLSYDLTRLGQMFERNPNLYADISARFGDIAPIPRFTAQFFQKYADRVLYGTDMPYTQRMFSSTFRILETLDEHFYEFDLDVCYDYHWPLHGLGLSDDLLKKVYRDNALAVFQRARDKASA